MRQLLLLAYHFPPIGGAAAQRSTKLARYLPELDWGLDVITGPGRPEYRWSPVDETLLEEVPAGTRVHRLPGSEPARNARWRERAERWAWLGSRWQRWWDDGVSALAPHAGRAADVVYASVAPFETAGTAVRTARALSKPLIVDLEDPWALDEMMIYPTGIHRRVELRRMRSLLSAADGIVMNTAEAAARVRLRYPELDRTPVVAIPNGYDRADFAGSVERSPGPLRIVHAGSLHTDLGTRHRRRRPVRRILGGGTPHVDLLTRSHVYLLEAMRGLVRERPELEHRLELHLVGTLTSADRRAMNGATFVREHGFLTHGETVRIVQAADLAFLPMHDVPAGHRISIVPCKTYEYLASGRPILAAVPDGDARDLLEEAGNAYLCRPTDVAGMQRAIIDALQRLDSRGGHPPPSAALLDRLERRRLTADLVGFIEDVLRLDRRVPPTG